MPVFCGNSNTEEGDEIVNIAWDEIIVIVMEENNDIFLVVDYALVYLVIPLHNKYSTTFAWGHSFSMYVHKKYSTTFVWGHSLSMYVSYDQ